MDNWKNEAIEIATSNPDMSWREIARILGKPKSTVSDNLRKHFNGYVSPSDKNFKKEAKQLTGGHPKILIFDIETSTIVSEVFRLFKVNVGTDQIMEDWQVLSFGWKWLGEEETYYMDVDNFTERELLEKLQQLFNEADFAVAHNGRRFDMKKVRARMIIHGLPPSNPVRVIDTLEIARKEFGFTSNKLEYLTHTLCKVYQKSGHERFSGFELWKQFRLGNPEAIREMREYCILDVQSLEELFLILAPWSSRLPNFDLYTDEPLDNEDWEHVGYHRTNLGKYDKYRHKVTGQYRRGRVNLLTKEKRATLLANIV